MTNRSDYIPNYLDDYDLTQAFLKLGRRLFGREWTANDQELRDIHRPPNPETLKAEIDELKRSADRLQNQIRALHGEIAKLVSEAEIFKRQARIAELSDQQSRIYSELSSKPTYGESLIHEWNRFARKIATESRLIEAIQRGELKIWTHTCSTPTDKGPWTGTPGYGYNIALSMVRWPRYVSDVRHQFVRIYKKNFDEWLLTVPPAPGSAAEKKLTGEERARFWLANQIKQHPNKKPQKKFYYIDTMMRDFGILKAVADRVWMELVTPTWQKSGRPRFKNRSAQGETDR